jgi:hypothetical protein
MSNANFTTTILVDKPASEVFHAINNVRGWWEGKIEGETKKPGDEFTYRMKDIHYSKQKLVEVVPGKRIVWEVTESKLPAFKDEVEWTGTQIIFELSEKNGQTEVRFTHAGLVPAFECYGGCSWAWGELGMGRAGTGKSAQPHHHGKGHESF